MKKTFLLVFGMLFACSGAAFAWQTRASSSDLSGLMGEMSPSKTWDYSGYTVTQYAFASDISNSPVQLEGTESMRERGIFPFSNEKDHRLFFLYAGDDHVKQTIFTLPTIRTCFGCATSLTMQSYPVAFFVGDRLVVQREESWYLYDPVSDSAELWFNAEEAGLENYSGSWEAFSYNDELYVSSYLEQQENGFGVYWVTKPNVIERHSEMPGDLSYSPNGVAPSYASSSYTTPKYLKGLDALENGDIVGRIDDGVYVYRASNKSLSRIGYAGGSSLGYYGYALGFSPENPLVFGGDRIAWIGTDDALYIATITGALTNTGIQDVIPYVPFRTVSSSTVYYTPANPGGRLKYMTADAYVREQNDPTFSLVITIPDSAVDAEDYLSKATPVY